MFNPTNSQNAEADYEEQKQIYKWFESSREINLPMSGNDTAWMPSPNPLIILILRRAYILAVSPVIQHQR